MAYLWVCDVLDWLEKIFRDDPIKLKALGTADNLIKAVENGRANYLNNLMHKGVRINVQDTSGMTPLIRAIQLSDEKIVDILVQDRYTINRADNQGKTPLMYAVETQNPQIIKTLLNKGAQIQYGIRDKITGKMLEDALTLADKQENRAAWNILKNYIDSTGINPYNNPATSEQEEMKRVYNNLFKAQYNSAQQSEYQNTQTMYTQQNTAQNFDTQIYETDDTEYDEDFEDDEFDDDESGSTSQNTAARRDEKTANNLVYNVQPDGTVEMVKQDKWERYINAAGPQRKRNKCLYGREDMNAINPFYKDHK